MAINPSDISNIGLAGGNPVEAMAQGYKLADLVDQRQMNKMKMQAYQQEAQDAQTLKSLAKNFDTTTEEGRSGLAAAVAKVDPSKSIELQKIFTELESKQNENLKSQYDIVGKKMQFEAAAIAPYWQQASQMETQGRSPQEIDAALLPAISQTLKTLGQQTLPNGKPVLSQEEIAGFAAKLQNGNVKGALQSVMMSHEKGAEWLKMQQPKFGRPFAMTGKQGPGMYVMGADGEPRYVGGQAPTSAAQNQAAGVTAAGGLDDETATALAGQLAEGVPPRDVIAGLSAKDRAKVQNQYTKVMQEQGLSPAMMVAKRLQLRATQKAVDAAAAQGGKVSTGLIELQEFAPLAREASSKVNREKFKPYNQLVQIGERNLNDPDLARLYAMTTSVLNAYDVVASRGGTDVGKREHAREMLSTAMDQKAYNVALDTIVQESEAAERAAQKAMQPGVYNPAFQAPAAQSANAAPAGGAPKQITEGTIIYSNDPTKPNKILRGGEWQVMQ
jgi:hypothetical protein